MLFLDKETNDDIANTNPSKERKKEMYNFYTNLHPIPLHMVLTLVRWDLPVCAGSISKSLLLPTKTEYKKTEIVSSLLFDLQQEALKGCKIPIPRDSDVILV